MPRPVSQGAAALFEHPFANRDHQPGSLRMGNELGRRNRATMRIGPAQQGFGAHNATGQVDLRLIGQMEFIVPKRGRDIAAEPILPRELCLHCVDAAGKHGDGYHGIRPCAGISDYLRHMDRKGQRHRRAGEHDKGQQAHADQDQLDVALLALVVEVTQCGDNQQIEMSDPWRLGIGDVKQKPHCDGYRHEGDLRGQEPEGELALSDQQIRRDPGRYDGDIERYYDPPADCGKDHCPAQANGRDRQGTVSKGNDHPS